MEKKNSMAGKSTCMQLHSIQNPWISMSPKPAISSNQEISGMLSTTFYIQRHESMFINANSVEAHCSMLLDALLAVARVTVHPRLSHSASPKSSKFEPPNVATSWEVLPGLLGTSSLLASHSLLMQHRSYIRVTHVLILDGRSSWFLGTLRSSSSLDWDYPPLDARRLAHVVSQQCSSCECSHARTASFQAS